MIEQIHFRNQLAEIYEAKRVKNSRYSKASFARKIGLSPPALSQFLNGQRRLSKQKALSICRRLELSKEREEVLLSFFTQDDSSKNNYRICPDLSGHFANIMDGCRYEYSVEHRGFLSLTVSRSSADIQKQTTHYILDGVLRPIRDFEEYSVHASLSATHSLLKGCKILSHKSTNLLYTVQSSFSLNEDGDLILNQNSFDYNGHWLKSGTTIYTNLKNKKTIAETKAFRPVP